MFSALYSKYCGKFVPRIQSVLLESFFGFLETSIQLKTDYQKLVVVWQWFNVRPIALDGRSYSVAKVYTNDRI
jgi:hypothetical protein